jgi:hypothetical protein
LVWRGRSIAVSKSIRAGLVQVLVSDAIGPVAGIFASRLSIGNERVAPVRSLQLEQIERDQDRRRAAREFTPGLGGLKTLG